MVRERFLFLTMSLVYLICYWWWKHIVFLLKKLHPLSLSEMQCTFKKTKNNDFQRRRAITYKVCSLVRWQWNKFNWLLIFASFPSGIHWHQSSCLIAPSISIQHSLFRRAGSANVSGKDNSLLLSAICTITSVYNGIFFSWTPVRRDEKYQQSNVRLSWIGTSYCLLAAHEITTFLDDKAWNETSVNETGQQLFTKRSRGRTIGEIFGSSTI